MGAIREVTDDVAHDPKAPLSRLRARLELALLSPGDAEGQKEAIRTAIAEADRLLATFNALLGLADAEGGARCGQTGPLDLSEMPRRRPSCTSRGPRNRVFSYRWRRNLGW